MSNEMMMALGDFRFAINNAAYNSLRRTHEYRWQAQGRLQQRPSQQYSGQGQETIELSGVIYPHFRGGLEQINNMRTMAGEGEPLLLLDGKGHYWGKYVILRIEESQSHFTINGQPLKQEFRLSISHYGTV